MKYSLNELLSNDVASNDYIGNLINEEGKFRKIATWMGQALDKPLRGAVEKVHGKHGARIKKFIDRYPNFPYNEQEQNFADGLQNLKDIYDAILEDDSIDAEDKNYLIDELRQLVIDRMNVNDFRRYRDEEVDIKLERSDRFTKMGQDQLKSGKEATRLGAMEKLLNLMKDVPASESGREREKEKKKKQKEEGDESKKDKDKKDKPEGGDESGSGDIQELVEEISDLLQKDDFSEAVSVKVAKRIIKRVVRRMNRGKFNDSILRKSIGPMLKRAEIDDNVSKEILDAISEHFELAGKSTTKNQNVDENVPKLQESELQNVKNDLIDALTVKDDLKTFYGSILELLHSAGGLSVRGKGELSKDNYPLIEELKKLNFKTLKSGANKIAIINAILGFLDDQKYLTKPTKEMNKSIVESKLLYVERLQRIAGIL